MSVSVFLPDQSDAAVDAALSGLAPDAPIAGVDEAGRGPWAGPVVAAAVILEPGAVPNGLDDSKRLSEAARERLFETITARASVGIAIGSVAAIEARNILGATMDAMADAVAQLGDAPALALIDGNRTPDLACPALPVIKGDGKLAAIAAASIVAKVTRDRIMHALDQELPGYGWARNKGYGTPDHQAGLRRLGVTVHHRRGFKPIQALLEEAQSPDTDSSIRVAASH